MSILDAIPIAMAVRLSVRLRLNIPANNSVLITAMAKYFIR